MTVERALVGEVLALQRRAVAVELDGEYEEIGIRSFGRGIFHKEPVSGVDLGDKRVFRIEANDLVISNVFAWEGAIAVASQKEIGKIGSHRFMTFMPADSRIDTSWASWFFRSEPGLALIGQASPGSAGRNRTLAIDRFAALEIPLPPIEEQRRVAVRVDQISARCAELDQRRQKSEGLQRSLIESRVDQLFSEIDAPEVPVEELGEVRGGIQKGPARAPGASPVRYLTVAHVGRDEIRLGDPRYFEVSPAELGRRLLRSGDVLIIEGNGSAEQIGRAALFAGAEEPFVHQNHVIRVRPSTDLVEPDYLNLFLNSPAGRRSVRAQARTSSGLQSLSVGRIKQILVPVPTLDVQRERAATARRLQLQDSQVAELSRRGADMTKAVLPAALNEAFAGLS